MSTPIHVFAEIASRYGVDPSNQEAVDRFFYNEDNRLSRDEQIAIMEELVCRDGEQIHEPADRIS